MDNSQQTSRTEPSTSRVENSTGLHLPPPPPPAVPIEPRPPLSTGRPDYNQHIFTFKEEDDGDIPGGPAQRVAPPHPPPPIPQRMLWLRIPVPHTTDDFRCRIVLYGPRPIPPFVPAAFWGSPFAAPHFEPTSFNSRGCLHTDTPLPSFAATWPNYNNFNRHHNQLYQPYQQYHHQVCQQQHCHQQQHHPQQHHPQQHHPQQHNPQHYNQQHYNQQHYTQQQYNQQHYNQQRYTQQHYPQPGGIQEGMQPMVPPTVQPPPPPPVQHPPPPPPPSLVDDEGLWGLFG